jgi:hypothetical protein
MFGKFYLRIRNDYGIKLLDSDISLRDYNQLKFKSAILNNIVSAKTISGRDGYLIDVPSKLFYKCIGAEFEMYHTRAKMQLNDFDCQTSITENWKFTTYYYFLFFSNVALHRLLNKGYIYLHEKSALELSDSLNALLENNVVQIGTGNWFFRKNNETSSIVTIELQKAGANIHQLAWQDLKSTLKQSVGFSTNKISDAEFSILNNLYKHIKRDQKYSPSETRNYLNYSAEIILDELDSKILCPNLKTSDFIRNLTQFNYNQSINSSIMLSIIIGQYIFLLNSKIVEDIQLRDQKLFKLIKKYDRLHSS